MHVVSRAGVTLLELLVAIALIGMMAAIAGLGAPRAQLRTQNDAMRSALASARRAAIDSGVAVTRMISVHGVPHAMTALPDGSIVADSDLIVDRLSGGPPRLTTAPASAGRSAGAPQRVSHAR